MGLFGRDEKDPKELAKDSRLLEPRPQSVEPKPPAAGVSTAASEPTRNERPRSEPVEGDEVRVFLGKGSRLSGKLQFDGTAQLEGQIEGEISARDTLIVGAAAIVTAQINGNTVIIKGKVTGDINARKRVELRSPGKLFGNIVTPSLVIEDGVIFEGQCTMGTVEARAHEAKVVALGKEEKGGNGAFAQVSSEAAK
jgi:cytoskeletal protein CcmA (bactofilin family)